MNDRLDKILEVFTTPGWKYIIEDIYQFREAIAYIYDVKTPEELYKRKGELERLDWFLRLQEWYEYTRENV